MPGTRQRTVKKTRRVRQPKKAAANAGPKKAAATNVGRGGGQPSPIVIAVAVDHAAPPRRRAPRRLAAAPPAPVPFARGYNLISQPTPVVNLTPAPEPVKALALEPVMRTRDRKPNPTRPAPRAPDYTTSAEDILPDEAGPSSRPQDFEIQYEGWEQPALFAEAKRSGIGGINKKLRIDKLVFLLKKHD